jgi:hypothetical protein
MTTLEALPAVASRTYSACKKCGVDRYHIVVAHTAAGSAKLECEVCHAKKTVKVGAPKKATKAGKTGKKTKASVANRWVEAQAFLKAGEKKPYNMKAVFGLHSTIEHPKFGIGVVMGTAFQSVEVVFEDATRSLVHNRA